MSEHNRAIIGKEVGKQIRLLRSAKGISIQEAAESLELSTNHYADLERGKYFPRVETLVKIVDFYNCTMDDLFKNVIRNGYEKDTSEYLAMIRRMPPEKRKRVVEILKLLTEE